jgi:hypothetical protein
VGLVLDQRVSELPCVGRASRLHGAAKWAKEGVHIVDTLGCGLGRTTTGLARIADAFGTSVFTRAGMQFESHLGHSMTPRQRGFLLYVWTLTLLGSL